MVLCDWVLHKSSRKAQGCHLEIHTQLIALVASRCQHKGCAASSAVTFLLLLIVLCIDLPLITEALFFEVKPIVNNCAGSLPPAQDGEESNFPDIHKCTAHTGTAFPPFPLLYTRDFVVVLEDVFHLNHVYALCLNMGMHA